MPTKINKHLSTEDEAAGQYALEVDEQSFIPLEPIVCPGCGRFLGYQAVVWGVVKLKCTNSKCKKWLTLDISPDK